MSKEAIIALDVGNRRIGVAVAHVVARLPRPLTTLERNPQSITEIVRLVEDEGAGAVVVGLPRSLKGQDTAQTIATRAFIDELRTALTVPVYLNDEALTSRQAEAELNARGKTYTKAEIDALAAVYILEDYLQNPQGAPHV